MAVSATASVPTAHASKYLQQLCKHWQYNLRVEFTPEHGTVTFPRDARGADWPADALVTFDAGANALEVRIDASADGQLEALKGAVARHLDRFAFREAPLTFGWRWPSRAIARLVSPRRRTLSPGSPGGGPRRGHERSTKRLSGFGTRPGVTGWKWHRALKTVTPALCRGPPGDTSTQEAWARKFVRVPYEPMRPRAIRRSNGPRAGFGQRSA